MRKLKALDLCCSAGGASMGLHRAGFDVTGIDIKPQKRYPFRFIQGDALNLPVRLQDFDLIWASPHCQEYSRTRLMNPERKRFPEQIPQFREMLVSAGVPYIIENVPGAPLLNPIKLNGAMFGLPLYRERHFECSFFVLTPNIKHPRGMTVKGIFPVICGDGSIKSRDTIKRWKESLGIDWMVRHELAQAIPPAYSEYLARQAI